MSKAILLSSSTSVTRNFFQISSSWFLYLLLPFSFLSFCLFFSLSLPRVSPLRFFPVSTLLSHTPWQGEVQTGKQQQRVSHNQIAQLETRKTSTHFHSFVLPFSRFSFPPLLFSIYYLPVLSSSLSALSLSSAVVLSPVFFVPYLFPCIHQINRHTRP